ncbi:UNVERIFIED_CONTAM: Vacuolar protein sorting-associated protein 41 [Siphonaria sp. JEL0065]|nr:Vacuolar protein sorting-associated protein 41 [Siphonaria sp. JEL0065]
MLDSSVLLFKPSITRMRKLLEFMQRPYNPHYSDQGIFSSYFGGPNSTSCSSWFELPDLFNIQKPEIRYAGHLSQGIAIQHDFWSTLPPELDSPLRLVYESWKSAVQSLYSHQTQQMGRSDVSLVPSSHDDFQTMLKANTWTARTVIYTLMTKTTRLSPFANRVIGNRERYCARYTGCFHYFQTVSTASHPVWQKAYDARMLMASGDYEWIWLLDARDAFIMNGDIDLRVMLGQLVLETRHDSDIVIANDWNKFNAGSFFIHASEWTVNLFMDKWISYEPKNVHMREQGALLRMYNGNDVGIKKHLVNVPEERRHLFNSYFFGRETTDASSTSIPSTSDEGESEQESADNDLNKASSIDNSDQSLDENELEEDDNEEEDEEPVLKYQRLSGTLADTLKKDAVSTMSVSDRFLAVGTHCVVHILDLSGNNVKRFECHSACVNDICIDTSGEFVASASDDGKVVINSLYTPEVSPFKHRRPIKCVALEPDYSRKPSRNHGVKLYDATTSQKFAYIDRPSGSPRADLYCCNLCWKDDEPIMIGWADSVKIGVIKDRVKSESVLGTTAMGVLVPSKFVEIVSEFRTDFIVSGIAPLRGKIVLLSFITNLEETQDADVLPAPGDRERDEKSVCAVCPLCRA